MDERRNSAAFKIPFLVDDEVKTVGAYNGFSLLERVSGALHQADIRVSL
jgi:hypothetical protein